MTIPYGLQDTFSEEGLWWLKGNENKPEAGTLTFEPSNGATLRIFGSLQEVSSPFSILVDGIDQANIFGITRNGKPVTLIKAINKQRQINAPGFAVETWDTGLLIIGVHIDSETDDEIFTKCYFRFEKLEEWLESRLFSFEFADDSVTVTASVPRGSNLASHIDFDLSSIGAAYRSNKSVTHSEINAFRNLAIVPRAARSLKWLMAKATRIQDLASLCTGHFLPLTHLELSAPAEDLTEEHPRPRLARVYAQLTRQHAGQRPSHEPPLISANELFEANPAALQLWFDQYEIFNPAIGLFFTISSAKDMTVNVRFLLAIQALEVFHRRTTKAELMPADAFAPLVKTLVDAIPAAATVAMREKLKGTYAFINEPSLAQRLRSIVADLSIDLGGPPPAFPKSYQRKLVETRNYYTHFTETLQATALDGRGMYWASRRLILLLTFLFLRRLGISAKALLPLLERHREFAKLWKDAEVPQF
ncbi:hypothetical protein FJ936_30095 [Mesorhizobium sp. B2-4-13]|uniref:ApeA N-terminal domain 1-containing protein n=1 Tax=Mesorhizobium sp. B2-4-13 TaxID=2589936 RepID=UPI001152EDAB|nr:HEPN domain-containing protein [Mesorhizobium sp. B2-4-13]TPK79033.1 hypothetical protein FJ936_30095 [Mesorhizobium sp. B2-4-13]